MFLIYVHYIYLAVLKLYILKSGPLVTKVRYGQKFKMWGLMILFLALSASYTVMTVGGGKSLFL